MAQMSLWVELIYTSNGSPVRLGWLEEEGLPPVNSGFSPHHTGELTDHDRVIAQAGLVRIINVSDMRDRGAAYI